MSGKVIEFRTILGSLDSPYFRGDVYYARFGSRDIIDLLNLADLRTFHCGLNWIHIFGKKISDTGDIIPDELMKRKAPVTTNAVKSLKRAWNASIKKEEPEEARYDLMDNFIHIHCVSKLQIKKYYMDLDKGLI